MPGTFRTALEADLDLLANRDLLRGRQTMVEIARRSADSLDTIDGFTPWNAARMVELLRELGIAKVEADTPDDDEFSVLMARMRAAGHDG